MRVFLAEDQILVRRGIEQMLLAHGASVVGSAGEATGLEDAILRSGADLALLDIRMPPTNTDEGIRAGVELRRRSPGFPVVILSQYVEQLYFDELLAQGGGSAGYLLKDRVFDGRHFVDALRAVASGETVVDPEVVARLEQRRPTSGPLAELTPREYETLGHMATGISNTEIAERMFITEKAVARHINGIYAKLGMSEDANSSRRVRAVLTYLRR
jgi:DNA-binding NarL/FixJ family response regulator